jgi:hypothetical protein
VAVVAPTTKGLNLTPKQFKGFRADLDKAVQEAAQFAEVHPLPEHGAIGKGRHRVDYVHSKTKGGNSADHLARRIARDRPDILQAMKRGEYRSVRVAAMVADGCTDIRAESLAEHRREQGLS